MIAHHILLSIAIPLVLYLDHTSIKSAQIAVVQPPSIMAITQRKNSTDVYFDSDWESLPYFSSSRDTFISKGLMKQFDAEILLGQISFKQCAEIYNELHKCIRL